MDVDQVQRINKLADNLLKQGIALDRDDAIKKAEVMLSRDGSREISDLGLDKEKEKPEIKIEEEKEPETKQYPNHDELIDAMKKNTEFIVKKFKEYDSTITDLQKQLQIMREEIKNAKRAQFQSTPRPQPKQPQQKLQPQQSNTSNHPKQGEYKTDDVAIEKIFYFGK